MYTTRKLFDDLKCDFKKYIEFYQVKDRHPFLQKTITLLKSKTIFAIAVHRFGFLINTRFKNNKNNPVKFALKFYYHLGRFLSVVFSKVLILESSEIGSGLFLDSKGNIIIGVKKMGRSCAIGHNVTIGMGKTRDLPVIGDNVRIESNSIVYGGIQVGSGSEIKTSTVLTKSVPEKCLISGNPACVQKKNINNKIHFKCKM